MSSTRQLKQRLFETGKKVGIGATSSVITSNSILAESKAIQWRAFKLSLMMGLGSLIINGVKSAIDTKGLCRNLCTSLEISKYSNDIYELAKRIFSGDTTTRNLDATLKAAERLTGESLSSRQKKDARIIAGGATVVLRFLSLLAEDTASMLLGYLVLQSLGINSYYKELGASFTQTLFATTMTAGLEVASEQVALHMHKEDEWKSPFSFLNR